MSLKKKTYHVLLVDGYVSFMVILEHWESEKEDWKKFIYSKLLFGLFHEIVSAIKREDLPGYEKSGFVLDEEMDMSAIRGIRNMAFHIAENENQVINRGIRFLAWSTVFGDDVLQLNLVKLHEYMMSLYESHEEVQKEMAPFLKYVNEKVAGEETEPSA